jgi:SAM-dependent methyltransferase
MDESHHKKSWDFSSPYSQKWHHWVLDRIAAQLGSAQWGDTLEAGCSEGIFTAYLASRCRSISACDISPVALERANDRCAQYPNVRFNLVDLGKDEIAGKYDLAFAMDILSCIRGRRRLTSAVNKLVNSLNDGGVLIYTDNSMPLEIRQSWGSRRWWSPVLAIMEPDECVGFLKREFPLQLVYSEEYHPDIERGRDELIALFKKHSPLPTGGNALRTE